MLGMRPICSKDGKSKSYQDWLPGVNYIGFAEIHFPSLREL
jgi:hypothetical protein